MNVRSHTFRFITPGMTEGRNLPIRVWGCHTDRTRTNGPRPSSGSGHRNRRGALIDGHHGLPSPQRRRPTRRIGPSRQAVDAVVAGLTFQRHW